MQKDSVNQINIRKADGTLVKFNPDKLKQALRNSGASSDHANQILNRVEQQLFDGISSKKIYQLAYSFLRKKSHYSAGRYRLKKAISELGPSGYPFEIFVGRLFESFGYKVKVGEHLEGRCVQHEVDVIAVKPGEQYVIECKFHSDFKSKTNVQVPLYINSRFNDIKSKWIEDEQFKNLNFKGYVVTNSRFTQDAIKYAECAGLGLISWDYPKDASLKYYIDQSGLHPITSLNSLNKSHKRVILDEGIVLCSEIIHRADIMRKHAFSDQLINKVIKEAKMLIKQN